MKRLVNVSALDSKWPRHLIRKKSDEYDVDCSIESEHFGVFRNKYLLKLEGSEENIQLFLAFLKYSGFKIK